MDSQEKQLSSEPASRRRRWWPIFTFLSLSCLIVFAVLVLAGPTDKQHRFMVDAKMTKSKESFFQFGVKPVHWYRWAQFKSDMPFADLLHEARAELLAKGWIEDKSMGEGAMMFDLGGEHHIMIVEFPDSVYIETEQYRPANFFDRSRAWLKSRFGQTPTDSSKGSGSFE